MERAVPRRDGGSVFKSTGATVLAKTPALVAKPESELKGPSKGPANSPDVAGRAHGASSSSRPGLRADGLVEPWRHMDALSQDALPNWNAAQVSCLRSYTMDLFQGAPCPPNVSICKLIPETDSVQAATQVYSMGTEFAGQGTGARYRYLMDTDAAGGWCGACHGADLDCVLHAYGHPPFPAEKWMKFRELFVGYLASFVQYGTPKGTAAYAASWMAPIINRFAPQQSKCPGWRSPDKSRPWNAAVSCIGGILVVWRSTGRELYLGKQTQPFWAQALVSCSISEPGLQPKPQPTLRPASLTPPKLRREDSAPGALDMADPVLPVEAPAEAPVLVADSMEDARSHTLPEVSEEAIAADRDGHLLCSSIVESQIRPAGQQEREAEADESAGGIMDPAALEVFEFAGRGRKEAPVLKVSEADESAGGMQISGEPVECLDPAALEVSEEAARCANPEREGAATEKAFKVAEESKSVVPLIAEQAVCRDTPVQKASQVEAAGESNGVVTLHVEPDECPDPSVSEEAAGCAKPEREGAATEKEASKMETAEESKTVTLLTPELAKCLDASALEAKAGCKETSDLQKEWWTEDEHDANNLVSVFAGGHLEIWQLLESMYQSSIDAGGSAPTAEERSPAREHALPLPSTPCFAGELGASMIDE
eukprot:g30105.t1